MKARASSLDLDQLASASNVAELSNAIDTDSIAGELGIPASQAGEGITAILPTILGFLSAKVGGAGGLIGLLGAHGEVGANRNLGGALEELKGLSGRF